MKTNIISFIIIIWTLDVSGQVRIDPKISDLISRNEINLAFELIDDLLKVDSLNAELLSKRAFCNIRIENYDNALDDIKKSIEIDSLNLNALTTAAIVYALNDYNDTAEIYFNKILNLDSMYYKAYLNRGAIYYKQNKFDKALAEYEKAKKINPNDGYIYYNIAEIQLKKNKVGLAIENIKLALKLEHYDADNYYILGVCFYKNGQYRKSLKYFKKTISTTKFYDSSNENSILEIHKYMGMCYTYLGKNKKATKHLYLANLININGMPTFN